MRTSSSSFPFHECAKVFDLPEKEEIICSPIISASLVIPSVFFRPSIYYLDIIK